VRRRFRKVHGAFYTRRHPPASQPAKAAHGHALARPRGPSQTLGMDGDVGGFRTGKIALPVRVRGRRENGGDR
jgi:hypothetical protein